MQVPSLGRDFPLEEVMAPSIEVTAGESHGQRSLARLQSIGSQKVRHDLSDFASTELLSHYMKIKSPCLVIKYVNIAVT